MTALREAGRATAQVGSDVLELTPQGATKTWRPAVIPTGKTHKISHCFVPTRMLTVLEDRRQCTGWLTLQGIPTGPTEEGYTVSCHG